MVVWTQGAGQGCPLTPPQSPGLCAPLLACRDNWVGRQRSFHRVIRLDVSQELGLCVTCRDGAPPPARGTESQGETKQSYRPSPRRQGLAEPRGGGEAGGRPRQRQSGVSCKQLPSGALQGSFPTAPPCAPSPVCETQDEYRDPPQGLGWRTQERTQWGRALPRGRRLRAGADAHSPLEETVSRAAAESLTRLPPWTCREQRGRPAHCHGQHLEPRVPGRCRSDFFHR